MICCFEILLLSKQGNLLRAHQKAMKSFKSKNLDFEDFGQIGPKSSEAREKAEVEAEAKAETTHPQLPL